MIKEFGFNTVIGPLADVAITSSGYTSAEAFDKDAAKVKAYVRNAVRGLEDQKVNACVNFFPGYGDIAKSPDSARPTSTRTLQNIMEEDVPIYQDAIDAGADFVMVSQIAYKPIIIETTTTSAIETTTSEAPVTTTSGDTTSATESSTRQSEDVVATMLGDVT